jgi:cell division protein FtsQ
MKRSSVLKKQSVKRRNPKKVSNWIRVIRAIFGLSFKIGLLFSAIIGISVMFLYLYQYLISCPYLRLEQVSITGVEQGIKQELIEMSELDSGQGLFSIDLKAIKAKMERHPWVRTVNLEKRFPHTLIVKVEKEIPCAVVVLDRMFYMNRWGKLFKEVEQTDFKDYPVVTGILKEEKKDYPLRFAAGILDLFKANSGAWSLNALSEIHFNNKDNVSIYSMSLPAVIKIGSNELDLKGRELKKIIKHLTKTGRIHMVKAIDLNYGNGAVVSFRGSG